MNGDSVNWYSSANNDETFNSEYIGYSQKDDELVINSSNAKES